MFEFYIDSIVEWLNILGFEFQSDDPEVQTAILLVSLTVLGSVMTGIWRGVIWWWKRKQQKQLKEDLHPYFSATDIRKATQFYVPTHFQSNPPSQHHELIQAHKVTARQRLIPFFLNQAFKPDLDHQRFYIILAGSGMGKTTFMINLYMRYLQRKQFRGARFDIVLMPLGYPNLLDRIEKIEDPGNTILLLDGLDEDTEAVKNYKRRLNRILDKVQDFRFVVFTCRTQFFPSEEEEPKETGVVRFGSRHGFQTFAKMYLSPFDRKDIRRYLNKKYRRFQRKRKEKAIRIIDQSPNLMVRPMVLSYIDDLTEQPTSYTYASELYEDLIRKWIDREANRVPDERRTEFHGELYRFSRAVALNMYRNRKHRNGLFIGQKEIRPFADKHKIQLEEIEMQSRSLLNRNVRGQYKFAHKSILEYFLAIEASEHADFAAQLDLEGMDQAGTFLDELILLKLTLPLFAKLKGKATCCVGLHEEERDVSSLTPGEVRAITEFASDSVHQLEAFRPLKALKVLKLSGSAVQDVQPLSELRQLHTLNLSGTRVADLKSLEALDQMMYLYLDETNISSLDVVKGMKELRHLSCDKTAVSSLDPLFDLHHLENLSCAHTKINDLKPIRRLKALKELSCHHTPLASIGPVRDLVQLKTFHVGYTKIDNLSAVRGMTELESLHVGGATKIEQIKPLSELKSLLQLNLDYSSVKEIALLATLESLQEVSLRKTQVSDITPLLALQQLEVLVLDQSPIQSVEPLLKMKQLRQLIIGRRQFSESDRIRLGKGLPLCEIP